MRAPGRRLTLGNDMIKKILVPQDGSDYSATALSYGIWLAKKTGATVTGLHVVDAVSLEGPFIHDISAYMGMEPFLDFSAKIRQALEDKGKSIVGTFEDECRGRSVECEKEIVFGMISNEICEKARMSDLVIMGRHGLNERLEHGLLGSITEKVIRKSRRPVLLAPKSFAPLSRPVVAFDGGASSAKVLQSAVSWAETFSMPLTVITVLAGANGHVLKDAENYVKPHNINAEFAGLTGVPSDAIVKYVRDNGHDLVFMGATHHGRLMELVLGSTAEHVMRSVDVPFFLER